MLKAMDSHNLVAAHLLLHIDKLHLVTISVKGLKDILSDNQKVKASKRKAVNKALFCVLCALMSALP